MKNFLTATLLSIGMPMILMGDEVRQTQRGNNNAYCQDNEMSWLDWGLLKKHADVHRFVRLLCARRVMRGVEHERQRMTLNQLIQQANKSWHGAKRDQPDWSESSRCIALTVELRAAGVFVHLMFNAYWEPLDIELPRELRWRRWIDTAEDAPNDIADWRDAPPVSGNTYHVDSRSVVVLIADGQPLA